MDRRTFLKTAAIGSVTFAAGCGSNAPDTPTHLLKNLYSLVKAPDDMVTGEAAWYASTCRECPAGCGILAKNREGRVIKVEGNPLHPVNRGRLCMRGQAALQGLYNPDRITLPLVKKDGQFTPVSFGRALSMIREKAGTAAGNGENRVRMLTEAPGDSLLTLFQEAMAALNAEKPVVFEPFAYESLKTATHLVLGLKGLPEFQMEKADLLVGFGADFLETWLSPVRYAAAFKEMHGFKDGNKGRFIHISPLRSLTGANADDWLGVLPGGESAVALGLVRLALEAGRGGRLSGRVRQAAARVSKPYSPQVVAELAGISPEAFSGLADAVLAAKRPLILGAATIGAADPLCTDTAAMLLNLVLDPDLSLISPARRHTVECAFSRGEVLRFFDGLASEPPELLLIHNANPAFALANEPSVADALSNPGVYKVCFTLFMDETARMADMVFPLRHSLESWGEYAGVTGVRSLIQPAMGAMNDTMTAGDVFLKVAFGDQPPAKDFKTYMLERVSREAGLGDRVSVLKAISRGGVFTEKPAGKTVFSPSDAFEQVFSGRPEPAKSPALVTAGSIRFFDGRGANRPWLCEIPDPVTKIAWKTPLLMHPDDMAQKGVRSGDIVRLTTETGVIEAPAYASDSVRPGVYMIAAGQGHDSFGRYVRDSGGNPFAFLPPGAQPVSEGPNGCAFGVAVALTGKRISIPHTDGTRSQHHRKIAMSVRADHLAEKPVHVKPGYTMNDFPLVLPLPEGYDPHRDIYPPHEHDGHRWGMVIDLDRCIGCGACSAACYAENNLGVVGEARILEGREMSWMRIERYEDRMRPDNIVFLPMLCQHCDNGPCEAVCPVYAPHHGHEGLNNQIYNRCIGTRFCSQNCPYKVRRFNWFDWEWPKPMNLQLNPEVTVRSKGVMEKCSFCVQRIKHVEGVARNEGREVRDGEVMPACMQTCPTGAIVFGDLMDEKSTVRRLTDDRRAYQVMGYLNTKPAVIYLKKVVREKSFDV